jgi:hypothetical protein
LESLKREIRRRFTSPEAERVSASAQAGEEATSNQPLLWTESDMAIQNRHCWQIRFYDFNVYSDEKRAEKLRYMHENPVKRGLVSSPEL